jgi:DNA-binding Lrp family transcriptional regulator
MTASLQIDAIDRRIVAATQGGLPLCTRPYAAVAEELGLAPDEVMGRLRHLQALGVIRRIGAVPNHYALGYRANGMSVWDVEDGQVGELGRRVGALDFVTHCYRRPRHRPDGPYNLFAMVHGLGRAEVEDKVDRIAGLLGAASRGHDVLYSSQILKKTGLRLRGGKGE